MIECVKCRSKNVAINGYFSIELTEKEEKHEFHEDGQTKTKLTLVPRLGITDLVFDAFWCKDCGADLLEERDPRQPSQLLVDKISIIASG